MFIESYNGHTLQKKLQWKIVCNIPLYFKWIVQTNTLTLCYKTQFKCYGSIYWFEIKWNISIWFIAIFIISDVWSLQLLENILFIIVNFAGCRLNWISIRKKLFYPMILGLFWANIQGIRRKINKSCDFALNLKKLPGQQCSRYVFEIVWLETF